MMTTLEPPTRQAEAVHTSISMPRSSTGPHSGASDSGSMASFTPQVSVETGVTMGICSMVSFCASAAAFTRSSVEDRYSKP